MSAEHQIDALLHEEDEPDWMTQYSDKQEVYLQPVNLGNYTQQCQFDLKSLRSQFFVLSESYLMLPVRFTSKGAAYDAGTRLAFKRSVLDLISGCMIQSAGSTISNIQNQMAYNNIRQRLEHDLVWNEMEQPQLCSGIDTVPTLISSFGTQTPSVDLPADPLATNNLNSGLLQRTSAFKNQSTIPDGTTNIEALFKIPLKYIHTLFQAMDFPIVNQAFMLYFYLNLSSLNTAYPPMTCVGNNNGANPNPVITYPVEPNISIGINGYQHPQLFISVVKFKPELTQTIAAALSKGITKKIHFTESEFRVFNANTASNASVDNANITSSVVSPTRMFLLSPPTGHLTQENCRTLALNVAPITGLQARVNNLPVFELAPEHPEQLYELLKEQFSNYGSDIAPSGGAYSYRNWINGNRVYCVDFRKYGNRITNNNESVSINVSFKQGTTATPVDWISILERKMTLKLSISDAGIQTIVGAGDL